MSFGLFMVEKAWSAASRKPDRLKLQDSALLCIVVFALEGVGVVSAASYIDALVEASAVTKNHSALSSAFHNLKVEGNSVKVFRLP